jgi:hypothetical protein
MESPPAITQAEHHVRATLAAAGITLPDADIAFLAAQQPMLARTIQAVAQAAPE